MVKTSARPTSACTRGSPPNCATMAATAPTQIAAPTTVESNGVHALLSFGSPLGMSPSCAVRARFCWFGCGAGVGSDDFGEDARCGGHGQLRDREGAAGQGRRLEQPPGIVVVQLGERLAGDHLVADRDAQ